MKILVIEDSEKSAELEKKILEKKGHTIFVEHYGKDGLKTAKKEKPDLILLDIKLPDISGYDVCKKLKKSRKTRDITIFMVTSNDKIKDIEHAFRLGADDYITKPFRASALWPAIATKLKKLQEK
ncbi:MAG: response regulator [Candidatus Marinimicrobia bacterium]|nr:response regulator [Candidatus Neomarinimicrobiota bacterium]